METSSKRGKIPQKDWPLIIKRYEAGETLAAIARTYDCSPPAISYILSRSRARDAITDSAAPDAADPLQPGLIKTSNEASVSVTQGEAGVDEALPHLVQAHASIPIEELDPESPRVEVTRVPNGQAAAADERTDAIATAANGPDQRHAETRHPLDPSRDTSPVNSNLGRPAALSQSGEPRGTLHLALPQHGGHRADSQPHELRGSNASERTASQPARDQQQALSTPPGRQLPDRNSAGDDNGSVRTTTEPSRAKEGGAFIDRALRERVDEDIAAFLAAFDAALADDSVESRAALRQATDRLLRAGARTRIELERLEARVPLPPREKIGQAGSTWRPR
jgi:hypothetical protein